ncbi:MAG: DUF2764 family protein [Victivallales bacterium]|nr:DUF2764 family protein [Victivallales bacterium]
MPLDLFYFISTLPGLKSTGEGAFRLAEFFAACRTALSARDFSLLESLSLCPPGDWRKAAQGNAVISEWYSWQTAMRNAIVSFRARALKKEGAKFLREEGEGGGFTGDLKRLEAVLEEKTAWKRQQGWEALQWSKLDELEPMTHFCFDALVVYTLKMLLLESRRNYSAEAGRKVFEEIVQGRLAEASAHRVLSEG